MLLCCCSPPPPGLDDRVRQESGAEPRRELSAEFPVQESFVLDTHEPPQPLTINSVDFHSDDGGIGDAESEVRSIGKYAFPFNRPC